MTTSLSKNGVRNNQVINDFSQEAPTNIQTVRRNFESGKISIKEAAKECCRCGLTNYTDEAAALRIMYQHESPELLSFHSNTKVKHPDSVLLYRCGDFYKCYFEDAKTLSDCIGVIAMKEDGTPVSCFPFHELNTYLPRIIRAGHRVAICEDPRTTTQSDSTNQSDGRNQVTEETKSEAPTPSDGVPGAAYGESEKSQDSKVRPEVEALREQARRAGTWTSFNPEGLGDSLISELENALQSFESKLPEEIRAEKVAAYISKWREWLTARSRCISAAITGPARFPVARAEKLWNYERNAWKRLEDWADNIVRRCNSEQRLTGWDEVERLTAKAEKLERLQELMKKANKVVRSKASDIEKMDELIAMGFSEKTANEIMTPDEIGRTGFASFQLTNNLAKIKDTRAKIARHEALASKEDHSVEYEWGTLEFCYSDERYRMHFPGKPSPEILTFLKSHGWKWSRANSAWQRQITSDAHYNLKRFIEKFGGKVEPSPEASSPSDSSQHSTEETQSEAPTPSDGVQAAAYGEPEKSQNQDAPTVEGVEVVGYSEKALAIFGNTRPFADKLKEIGAKFNRALTYNGERRAGWIISRRKADDLSEILGAPSDSPTPSDGSHQDTEKTPDESPTPSDGVQAAPYGEGEKSQNPEAKCADSQREEVRDWYMHEYPTDDEGAKIQAGVTFSDIMANPARVYDYIPSDSIIRERVFSETANRYGVEYSDLYNRWMDDEDQPPSDGVQAAPYGVTEKSQNLVLNHAAQHINSCCR